MTLLDVYRLDKTYMNAQMDRYSIDKYDDDYTRYSERVRQNYAGYAFDDQYKLRATSAKVVNFKSYKNVLLSKDLSLVAEDGPHAWMFKGEYRYFDGESLEGHKASIISFPRAGNSLIRNYYESISHITTGSDFEQKIGILDQLRNERGTGIMDDSVWVIKSHHPQKTPHPGPTFRTSKVLMIVRNPLDCIVSMLNLLTFFSHSLTSQEPFN